MRPPSSSSLGQKKANSYRCLELRGKIHVRPVIFFSIQGRNAVVSLQIQTTRVAPDIVVVHLNGRLTTRVDDRVVEPVVTDLLNQNDGNSSSI